jgi:hypothetical protein
MMPMFSMLVSQQAFQIVLRVRKHAKTADIATVNTVMPHQLGGLRKSKKSRVMP